MQEQNTEKTVALSVKTGKMTAKVLKGAVKAFLDAQKNKKPHIYKGKQSVKHLVQGGGELTSIEVTDKNINGSAHALVCSGLTHDCKQLYALKSERIKATDVSPQALYKKVYDFCEDVQRQFGKITAMYADSAEQTLIAGLRIALKPLGIIVKNSLKRQINDRIRATTMTMGGGRFCIRSVDCGSLINAFEGAVWDDKQIGVEERLDDGTSDIDSLDAFEYSFERYIPQLIRGEK